MKKAIIALIALLSVTVSNATVAEITAEEEDYCRDLANSALIIMEKRQEGVSQSEMISRALGQPALEKIVRHAYSEQRYSDQSQKDEATLFFQQVRHLMCFQAASTN